MLLSLQWLREFVPYTGTAEELGERLTMLGLELEEIVRPFEAVRDIVVGRVLTCEKHPEADKLSVCTVNVGGPEILNIVCGAPNVAAGQLVPVAVVGTTMPDGLKIKKAKLRGVESCGMICSERELGLSEEHSGILVLPEQGPKGALEPGQNLVDALNLDTEVLDISITPNRADCLSVLGIAREVAALFDLPLTLPALHRVEGEGAAVDTELSITISDPSLCLAYTGRVLEGARVEASPAWMRYRLMAVGQRPISNLVDVTNYILMELGQPLHAFDRGCLGGDAIVVSPAVAGEKIVTLDGQERVLQPGDILIRDAYKPVALGGVMGGLESEITAETKSVFVECALFRPASIRRTARRLGLSSEASFRFERGVDPCGMEYALERATELMAQISGARVRRGVCANIPSPWVAPTMRFRKHKAEALLGTSLDENVCARILSQLGCTLDRTNPADWQVSAPGWRYDLSREADLIEEVARVQGVDNVPATLPVVQHTLDRFGLPETQFSFLGRVRHWGAALGMNEAINYSFVGNKDLDFLGLPMEGRMNILNPLTADQDVLRTSLVPSLLQNVRHNIAQGVTGLRLFEVANIYRADPASETTAYEEPHLCVALYGNRYDNPWLQGDLKEVDLDYPDLKGAVEHLFNHFHLPAPEFRLLCAEDSFGMYQSFLAPGVAVYSQGACLGVLGRIKPALAEEYHARKAVWVAELNLSLLQSQATDGNIQFQGLPVYPPVRRDITVMAETTLHINTLLQAIQAVKAPLLESVVVHDSYEPQGSNTRNLTFRLTFRHASRTLQDQEVDKEREKIAAALVENLGVRI